MHKNTLGTDSFRKYFMIIFLIIIFGFTILGVTLLSFVANYWQQESGASLMKNAKSVAAMTSKVINPQDMRIDTPSALIMCGTLKIISDSTNADVFVTDINGKVILCKERSPGSGEASVSGECEYHDSMVVEKALIDEMVQRKDYIDYNFITHGKTRNMLASAVIEVNCAPVGLAVISAPVSNLKPFVLDILKNFLFSAITALLLSFVFVYVMIYQMVKPLRSMACATKSFAKGDFSYRVNVQGNDEMAELGNAFNAMAKSLATTEASRRNFVANVSHELKTPMTTIGGFIDGILDGTIPPEKQNYYLKIVSDEVKRLSRLVVEMLNMSKIEAGEMKIKPTEFDISEKIFRILVSFEQAIDKKCIEIRGLEKMQSVTVEADGDMIHQVIYNLIDNAVKFTNEGGYIQVGVLVDMGNVVVSIRNSGEGISSEELGKVFERFYKVDKSRSKDVKGTGLGLYIVKSTIEMHGGQIIARSEQGQFSEFIFTLPLKYNGGN